MWIVSCYMWCFTRFEYLLRECKKGMILMEKCVSSWKNLRKGESHEINTWIEMDHKDYYGTNSMERCVSYDWYTMFDESEKNVRSESNRKRSERMKVLSKFQYKKLNMIKCNVYNKNRCGGLLYRFFICRNKKIDEVLAFWLNMW